MNFAIMEFIQPLVTSFLLGPHILLCALLSNILNKCPYVNRGGGIEVAQLLRCCARNRKVAGSIPDGVIGIFH